MDSNDFLIPSELDFGKIKRRSCLGQSGLRGVDLRLVGARIDDKQKLPTPEVFAVLKVPLNDAGR